MPLNISSGELRRAVDAGLLLPGRDLALLAWLQERPEQQASFQLAHVAYYFGALLIIAAMGWLLNEAWLGIGDHALLVIAAMYMTLFTLAGRSLWQRGLHIPGGLLGAVAVSLTPLLVFAIERLSGLWVLGDQQDDYHSYYTLVQGGWLVMEVATLLVGLAMLRLLPFPLVFCATIPTATNAVSAAATPVAANAPKTSRLWSRGIEWSVTIRPAARRQTTTPT